MYAGQYNVTDTTPDLEVNIGRLLLSPTRTYAPVLVRILKELRPQIHGLVHCSGGGQTKVLHFIDSLHVIKDNLFEIPPLFRLIQEQGQTAWREMFQVFNMGHRMEIYLEEKYAQQVIGISTSLGVEAKVIGRVEESDRKRITIKSEMGDFTYP